MTVFVPKDAAPSPGGSILVGPLTPFAPASTGGTHQTLGHSGASLSISLSKSSKHIPFKPGKPRVELHINFFKPRDTATMAFAFRVIQNPPFTCFIVYVFDFP